MNKCANCGKEAEDLYCDECYEEIIIESANKNAKRFFKLFVGIFIAAFCFCYFFFELGKSLPEEPKEVNFVKDVASLLGVSIFFGLIPLILSIHYSKKSKNNFILSTSVLILVIFIISLFIG